MEICTGWSHQIWQSESLQSHQSGKELGPHVKKSDFRNFPPDSNCFPHNALFEFLV